MSHEYEPTGEGAQRFMNAQWIQPDPNERAFREAGYVPDADGLWVKDPNYVAPAAPQQEMLRYGQVPPTTIDILTRITVNGSNQEHMDLLAAHALSNHLGMQQQRAPQPQPRDNPYLPQAYAPTYDSYGGSANEPTPPALPAGNSEWHPANQPGYRTTGQAPSYPARLHRWSRPTRGNRVVVQTSPTQPRLSMLI